MKRTLLAATIIIASSLPVVARTHSHNSMHWFWKLSTKFSHASMATWYGNENYQSRRADGQHYNPLIPGFACRGFSLGSMHSITNLTNGRTIRIPCNDRAGYGVPRGGVDLSLGAARMLGIAGRALVQVE